MGKRDEAVTRAPAAEAGKKRNASFELLRIYAILTIMVLHYQNWSGALLAPGKDAAAVNYLCELLESFCIPTLATYVMISGYFDHSTALRWKKLVKLWLQVEFYSVGIHAVLLALGAPVKTDNVWDLARIVLPVMTSHYWFVTAFVVMEILTPVFNAAADHMNRKALKGVILGMLVYFSLLKSVVPIHLAADGEGYDFGFFLLIYLIAVYLRKYGAPRFAAGHRAIALYAGSSLVIFLLTVTAYSVNRRTGSFSYLMSLPLHLNFIVTIAGSVGLFLAFSQLRIPEGKAADFIRGIAPLTFGVYLIHCHVDVEKVWPSFFAAVIGGYPRNPVLFVLWMLAVIVVMFGFCCAVDALRRILFALAARCAGNRS